MTNQEILALAIVSMVVAFAVMRFLNKNNNSDCDNCSKNPTQASGSDNGENVVTFHKKPPQ